MAVIWLAIIKLSYVSMSERKLANENTPNIMALWLSYVLLKSGLWHGGLGIILS